MKVLYSFHKNKFSEKIKKAEAKILAPASY